MPPVHRHLRIAAPLTAALVAIACGAPEPAASTGELAAVGAPVTAAVEPAAPATGTPRSTATRPAAPTPPVAPAALPTATPPPALAIHFTVDHPAIARGACTTLRWHVVGGLIVALDGADVPDSGTREVCPAESATYALLVTPFNGYDEQRAVSVVVNPADDTGQTGAAGDESDDDKPAAPPPPPPPTATPCDINCEVTPEPEDPLPELPTAAPAAPEPTDEPAPPAPEPTDEPAPPPEPTEPPAPAPAPAP